MKMKSFMIFNFFWNFQISVFYATPLNYACLIIKTASPGPIVSVPTPGSWEFHDFPWKTLKNLPGGIFSSVYGMAFQLFWSENTIKPTVCLVWCLQVFQNSWFFNMFNENIQNKLCVFIRNPSQTMLISMF